MGGDEISLIKLAKSMAAQMCFEEWTESAARPYWLLQPEKEWGI